ncbi:unnamed protein product [Cuscuta epithymum]|uniref:FAE domain-containing protein n=1 Tax=Cuscuta epithymum TaxID=186058 RepID=A0AAV0GCZ7_9ASTE|nr:unnamed protein product [Cuscuta epithymum]
MGDTAAGTGPKTENSGNNNKLPNFLLSVRLKYVKLGYHYLISNAMYLLLVPLLAAVSAHLSTLSVDDLVHLWRQHLKFELVTVAVCSALAVCLGTLYFSTRPRKVYLVDFACYKPPPEVMCPKQLFMDRSKQADVFTEENLSFQKKILERSGLGEKTYFPEALLRLPPSPSMAEARKEAEMVMFGAIDELLAKTGVNAKDIGILVVNCSLFNPTPSLSAMIVNHYKLRGNIQSYNLGGMGCSAGLISIHLAKQLLQVHPNSYALVVSMENITLNWYFGNNRSMLVSNCIFRMGGAAILLSNRSSDRRRSKYQLVHTVRTHKGADDRSYSCVFQEEDEKREVGVALSKDLMAVAGEALKTNITTLGPARAPDVGAAPVLRHAGRPEGDEAEDQAVHPGLQDGVRALLHPRGRESGAGRAGEEPGPERVAHGAVPNDTLPVREHVQQFVVVRAGLR